MSEFIQIQAKESDMLADAEARVEFLKKKITITTCFSFILVVYLIDFCQKSDFYLIHRQLHTETVPLKEQS